MDLKEALTNLAEVRRDLDAAAQAVARAKQALEETAEAKALAELKKQQAALSGEYMATDDQARALVLAEFQATANKAPAKGADISIYHEAEYDPARLLAWCQERRPTYVLLSLDVKRIDKNADDLMRDGAPLQIVERPRVRIATDLSEYLPKCHYCGVMATSNGPQGEPICADCAPVAEATAAVGEPTCKEEPDA